MSFQETLKSSLTLPDASPEDEQSLQTFANFFELFANSQYWLLHPDPNGQHTGENADTWFRHCQHALSSLVQRNGRRLPTLRNVILDIMKITCLHERLAQLPTNFVQRKFDELSAACLWNPATLAGPVQANVRAIADHVRDQAFAETD